MSRIVEHRSSGRGAVVLASIALLICTNGPSTYLALHVVPNGTQATWTSLYPFAAVAIGGVVGLTRRLNGVEWRQWPWPMWPLAGYVAWALGSAVWSVSPQTTAQQSIVGLGIAAFGCWFGCCLTTDQQMVAVFLAAASAVVASAAVIALLPQYGKMYPLALPNSDWQGIFGNRNSLAPICVLAILACVGFAATRPALVRLTLALPVAAVSVVLLRGSSGATSLAAFAAALVTAAIVPLVWLLKRLRAPSWTVGVFSSAVSSMGWALTLRHMDAVAKFLGRDATISGRRLIWADVRSFIREHPIRGFGYWAFWDRADLTAATYAHVTSAYASAHNSFLEVMLGLGVIGLVLYLAIVLYAIVGIAREVWVAPCLGSWWWACVVAFLLVQNLMESFVLWNSYNWVLLIAAALVPFRSRFLVDDNSHPVSKMHVQVPSGQQMETSNVFDWSDFDDETRLRAGREVTSAPLA